MGRLRIIPTVLAGLALAGCGASPAAPGSEEPGADPTICETRPLGDPCKFGQTAIYVDEVRAGTVSLEITVEEPVEFDPSPDASILHDLPPGPVNVYFPVTVKNTSAETSTDMAFGQATNAEQGKYDGIRMISDGDIESVFPDIQHLAQGEGMTFKHGWTMDTLDGIEYEVSIDGLSGYSFKFVR